MNILGKSFVALILVMSLMFLGMSLMVYATHKGEPEVINRAAQEARPGAPIGLKHRLSKAKQQAAEREAQQARLSTVVGGEQATRRLALASLQVEKVELRREHEQLLEQEASTKDETRIAQEATKQAQEMLRAKLAEIATLSEQMAKAYAERDAQLEDSIHLEDKLHQAINELERAKSNSKR